MSVSVPFLLFMRCVSLCCVFVTQFDAVQYKRRRQLYQCWMCWPINGYSVRKKRAHTSHRIFSAWIIHRSVFVYSRTKEIFSSTPSTRRLNDTSCFLGVVLAQSDLYRRNCDWMFVRVTAYSILEWEKRTKKREKSSFSIYTLIKNDNNLLFSPGSILIEQKTLFVATLCSFFCTKQKIITIFSVLHFVFVKWSDLVCVRARDVELCTFSCRSTSIVCRFLFLFKI